MSRQRWHAQREPGQGMRILEEARSLGMLDFRGLQGQALCGSHADHDLLVSPRTLRKHGRFACRMCIDILQATSSIGDQP